MNYHESVQWLEGVSVYSRKDGLNNMVALMKKLGDVQKKCRFVHVAGTNGKGTVCALLSSMLSADGRKVGLYTSPHLVEYTARIQFSSEEKTVPAGEGVAAANGFSAISREEFARLAERVRNAAEEVVREGGAHPTFFQLLTAIAFLAFEAHQVEVVVLEVGVGGRLDATNIIENPLACVITSISLDHTKVLGNTVEEIAWEKAGIIKPGASVIIGPNRESVCQVIEQVAAEKKAQAFRAESAAETVREGVFGAQQVFLADGSCAVTQFRGDYQQDNIRTALQTAHVLGLSDQTVREGLEKAFWPGRMELFEAHTVPAFGENGPQVPWILEGAHNEDGAKMLRLWCDRFLGGTQSTLVFSALKKKDIRAILQALLGSGPIPFSTVIFGRMSYEGGMEEEEFFQLVRELGLSEKPSLKILSGGSLEQALLSADRLTKPGSMVVAAGSLYLVGEILEWMYRRKE